MRKSKFLAIILGPGAAAALDLLLPAAAAARWPAAGGARVQPALVLALTLTSLVLFLIYLFQKKKPGRTRVEAPGAGDSYSDTRRRETDLAMARLFDQQVFPMAKFDLATGQMLDVTGPLCTALGWEKHELLEKTCFDLGLLQASSGGKGALISRGWNEVAGRLARKSSTRPVTCRVLNLAIQDSTPGIVISIVSGMDEKTGPAWAGQGKKFKKNAAAH